jgi:hypothetical protein
MKKIFIILSLTTLIFSAAFADKKSDKPIRRIKIHSADPQLIALLLSGKQNYNIAPEISTVKNNQNSGNASGGK